MSQKKMTFSQKFQKAKSSGSFSAALMLAPAVFFLCLCSIYPFIWIFRYVACDYNGFKSTFTGWKNFERMLNDKVFWNSVMHTFEYAFYRQLERTPIVFVSDGYLATHSYADSLPRCLPNQKLQTA